MSKWDGKTYAQRFQERYVVDPTTGCWIWTAGKNGRGYGYITINNRAVQAYKFSWELVNGPVPNGLDLDHLCRVPLCVNPDHLEAVTRKEHQHRGLTIGAKNIAKTACPKGHPYDVVYKNGARGCSQCRAATIAAYRLRGRGGRPALRMSLRTHCPRGHPYDVFTEKPKHRGCSICNREKSRRYRRKNNAM